MPPKRKLIRSFLILVLFYGIFSIQWPFFENLYGEFYRSVCSKFFSRIDGNGFAMFKSGHNSDITNLYIGNYSSAKPDGTAAAEQTEVNTRLQGYLPTLLIISLVIATPVSLRRKIFALPAGLILVTLWVVLKQWLHILYICVNHPYLKLYSFSDQKTKLIAFLFENFSMPLMPSLVVAVFTWLLVTLRKDDIPKTFVPAPIRRSK